jgi:hypothetical protein
MTVAQIPPAPGFALHAVWKMPATGSWRVKRRRGVGHGCGLMPKPASSPWILRYHQPGFSRASRRTSARMSLRVVGGQSCRAWTWRPGGGGRRCRGASVRPCPVKPAASALAGALSVSGRAGPRAGPDLPSSVSDGTAAAAAGRGPGGAGSGFLPSSTHPHAATAVATPGP